MKQPRVVILDTNALSRNGLKALVVQAGIPAEQVRDVADVDSLPGDLDGQVANILFLSDTLPDGYDALQLVQSLHRSHPGVNQVIVSARLNTDYIRGLFQRGAQGFVYRQSRLEHTIPAALQAVGSGETYLSPEAAVLPYHRRSLPQALTARDLEVLDLLADGQSIPDIARTIGVTRRVVYSIRTRLRQYLGASNNEQIVAAAIARGLLMEKLTLP